MIGIYKIQNLINNKCYIGQSTKIEKRWQNEINASKNPNDKAYNYPLQRAFRKYGENNFSFEVLEECLIDELNKKERYWVSKYDSFFHGYNQTMGGDGSYNAPKEKIIGIINDLKTTDMYHREIAEKWKISQEMVQGINTGRYWVIDGEDYPLQKKHKANSAHIINGVRQIKKTFCQKCGKEITRGSNYCIDCYNLLNRKVERPSKEDLEKYLFSINGNFTEAGKKFGVTDNSVRKWCKSYGLSTYSSDYKVKVENPNKGRTIPKKVLQFDMDDNFIAEYESIADACRAIGKPGESSHISAVCKGKRNSASGYKWKYKEEL